ncbi:MAG: ribbon-helix-helix domain-containing protein [Eubacteriales bacterium]
MIFKQNKSEKTVISIRLDTELLERIDKMATARNLSRNEIICQGISYALDVEESKA